MAVTLTLTTGSNGVATVDLELDLYAGTPVGDTEWLKGFGSQYPGGGTDEFAASNSDGSATAGLKLVVGRFTATENNNVFTVGGDASKILACVVGTNGTAGQSLGFDGFTSGDATLTMIAEGSTGSNTMCGFMMIVA